VPLLEQGWQSWMSAAGSDPQKSWTGWWEKEISVLHKVRLRVTSGAWNRPEYPGPKPSR
jgi:hypothetical protein